MRYISQRSQPVPVPLPQRFRYGYNCQLTKKGMVDNFPSYPYRNHCGSGTGEHRQK